LISLTTTKTNKNTTTKHGERDRAPQGGARPLLCTLHKKCASRLRFDEATGRGNDVDWKIKIEQQTDEKKTHDFVISRFLLVKNSGFFNG
jgi:hypothetical protein